MYIEGEPLVDDLTLVLLYLNEEIPEGYVVVGRTTNAGVGTGSSSSSSGSYSSPSDGRGGGERDTERSSTPQVCICYHRRGAMGLCDLRFESATIDRYPQQDNKGLPLPANELSLFAFPHDLRLEYGALNRFPLPVFFTFVFTDALGGHLYTACLRFYEKVSHGDLDPIIKQVYGDQVSLQVLEGKDIFCPKVVCVVSSRPFYRYGLLLAFSIPFTHPRPHASFTHGMKNK